MSFIMSGYGIVPQSIFKHNLGANEFKLLVYYYTLTGFQESPESDEVIQKTLSLSHKEFTDAKKALIDTGHIFEDAEEDCFYVCPTPRPLKKE